tara:strand:- start:111 stop:275 length:165 start_codon:yes stop_codon:yes gene_type:complete
MTELNKCVKCEANCDSPEDWQMTFANILLCDDCYTETRVLIADHLNLELQDLDI